MRTPMVRSLHAACTRYGPGRLPRANRVDVGAGYAAASAAFGSALLFATATLAADAIGAPAGVAGTVFAGFAILALPVVVPTAFVVGVVVWRTLPTRTPRSGVVAGFVGTIGTYVGALLVVGVLLTTLAALSHTGADPPSAAAFSFGLVYIAFTLTWWLTIPIGCASGAVYATVVRSSP